jgi:PilZ domain
MRRAVRHREGFAMPATPCQPREELEAQPAMIDDPEAIAMRPTVVDGVRQDDNYEITWRGLPIGRILKEPHNPHWWWGCNVYGQPPTPNDRGPGINLKDCQVRFKLAWARIRPTLTEQDIAVATRHAEGLIQRSQPVSDLQSNPEALQVMDNKRGAPRQRVLKSGTIEFHGGAIDCVVRNISDTGAALDVASPVGIPAEFKLLVSGDGVQQHCRVVWRRDKRIGVRFGSD